MRSFGHKKYIVAGSCLLWLWVTFNFAWSYFHQPDFKVGLLALPAIGFFLCIGMVVWAMLESDKDLVWKNAPLADQKK